MSFQSILLDGVLLLDIFMCLFVVVVVIVVLVVAVVVVLDIIPKSVSCCLTNHSRRQIWRSLALDLQNEGLLFTP